MSATLASVGLLGGIGAPELVVILIIVLVLFGPKRLPQLGSSLGKTVKNIREGMESEDAEDDAEDVEYEDDEDEEPSYQLVRNKRFFFRPMSVEEAILQMNLVDHTFFAFRNDDEGGAFSVVYKRNDGGYGIIVDQD